MTEAEEQYEVYRQNALPGMVDHLASNLGVSAVALNAIGLGWKIDENAWIFPERDETGSIVGLTRRFHDGKKLSTKGHKRGMIFAPETLADGYEAHRQRWRRVTEGEPCPICGKPDWCGLDGNTYPPRFVRCMRTAENSVHECASGGHIHELVPLSFQPPAKKGVVLPASDWPVLVVEGATDTAAAIDLGFVAVGRPSAEWSGQPLAVLLGGRSVAVIGENDSGAGRKGMEKAAAFLAERCVSVAQLMPPNGIKDLRDWVRHGLTAEELLEHIRTADKPEDGPVLEDVSPLALAQLWLRKERWLGDMPTLRKWEGCWFQYTNPGYELVKPDTGLRQPLYKFLANRRYKKVTSKGVMIENYVVTRSKLDDIIDALLMECPVLDAPPLWLDGRDGPDPSKLIVFQNGILDTDIHMAGGNGLRPADPNLFHLSSIPYDWSGEARCPRWRQFLKQIFSGDVEREKLLQEWFGYNMVADTSQEKLMFFVGRPGSGKSTTLDVLRLMLGNGQCARSSFKDLCSDFGRQPLVGKLAIILPDAHVPRGGDAVQALETIKSIVGRDGVTVNRKFLEQLPEVTLTGRFTIAVNELPELPDHSQSLERRLLLIYFPETFVGREDRTLKDKFVQEAPGIAVWALEGLRRLREEGKFTVPQSSTPVVEEFMRLMTPVAEFVDECCIYDKKQWVSADQLYDVWVMWTKVRGIRSDSRTAFGQRLLGQNASIKSRKISVGDDLVRCWAGLGWSPEGRKFLMRSL